MHKRTLSWAATALLTSITLVLTASIPAAEAKPKSGAHGHATVKVDAAAKHLAAARRTAIRLVATTDARLARAAAEDRLAGLDPENADVLRVGIASDRDLIAGLGEQAATAGTLAEVRALTASIRAVRVEVWAIAVDVLDDAASLAAAIEETTAALDAAEDVSLDAYLALDDAWASVDIAVGKALTTTAFGGKTDLLTAYDDLAAAAIALTVAASYLPV